MVSRDDVRASRPLTCEARAERRYFTVNHSPHTAFPSIIKVVLKMMLITWDLEFYGVCASLSRSDVHSPHQFSAQPEGGAGSPPPTAGGEAGCSQRP